MDYWKSTMRTGGVPRNAVVCKTEDKFPIRVPFWVP